MVPNPSPHHDSSLSLGEASHILHHIDSYYGGADVCRNVLLHTDRRVDVRV